MFSMADNVGFVNYKIPNNKLANLLNLNINKRNKFAYLKPRNMILSCVLIRTCNYRISKWISKDYATKLIETLKKLIAVLEHGQYHKKL